MTIQTQTLTTLSLAVNDIGIEGARYLGTALQNNTVSDILTHLLHFHDDYSNIDTHNAGS